MQFLLDGSVTVTGPDGKHDVRAPAALGFEELLEGSPMHASVVAAERSITLSLTSDEFLALLSENVELAEGIFRMMIESHDLATGHTLIHGTLAPDVKDGRKRICSRSIGCCCCNRARCSRTPRRRSCGGLSAIARPVTSPPGKEAIAARRRGVDPDRAVGVAEGRDGADCVGTADSRRRDRHV